MPAVCLVAQKPRECTQEYVIIEALIKGDDVEIDILARITLRRTLRMTDRNRAKCENRDRDAKDLCRQTHTVLPLRFSRITRHPTGLIMLLLSWEPSQAVPGRRSVAQRQCRPAYRANRAEVWGARLLGALPTMAFAQLEATAERRAACMGDAIMLCSSAIPNKARGSRPAWRRKWINSLRAAGRSSASADGHTQNISNRSSATSNRVSDATTRILKIGDQRLAREIGRLRPKIRKKCLRDCVASR